MRDLPQIQKLLNDIDSISKFKKAIPIIRLVFPNFGGDSEELEKAFLKIEDLQKEFDIHVDVLEKFNQIFAKHGWIMHDSISMEVAKDVVEIAEQGDFETANQMLIDYYSPEYVKARLNSFIILEAFKERMPLARLALEDYENGRYHSTILVILSLMDGLVNDVHPENKGIHSTGINLSAWDSVAAHNSGLNVLIQKMQIGRKKTRTESLDFPYRHGIMHGMDLGYANPEVAAKTWALLFGVKDWAQKAEAGDLEPEEPASSDFSWEEAFSSLKETYGKLKKSNEFKKKLEDWEPRQIQIGTDIPKHGNLEDYPEKTPESTVVNFLKLLEKRNYGHMANLISPYRKYKVSPKDIRAYFEDFALDNWELTSVVDQGAALTRVKAEIVGSRSNILFNKEVELIAISVNSDGQTELVDDSRRWLLSLWRI